MDDDEKLWPSPPDVLSVAWEDVHVWAISLQISSVALGHFAIMLAPNERQRADAFHFDRDRDRYMAGRGTLRTILARYLNTHPRTIALEYGPHGKPTLAERFARSRLQFNLAHCEDRAVLAVARGRAVGIDLERVRSMDDAQEMAADFCSPRENDEFQCLPPIDRDAAFFRLWTRKEAWLKATGEGVGRSLDKVEVSFRKGQAPCFIRLPEEAGPPAGGWRLHELTPAPGFVAALALPGQEARVSCWNWKQEEPIEYVQA
jgi:4'-phosphopantetheinyl transferase